MRNAIAMLVGSVLLVGCATSDNPREGGFFGGVQGLNSGAYDKRLQEREESLERLNAMKRELKTEQAGLKTEKSERQARIRELQGRLSRLDRETEQLVRDLENSRAVLASDKQKQARLKRDVAKLQQEIAALEKQATSDRPVLELEAERDKLEEEYRLLLDLYLELGK